MSEIERLFGSVAVWFAPVTALAALVVGLAIGLGPAFLVLAGGILLGAVMLLWSSLGRLTGEAPLTLDEAIGLAAPSAEEERKRAVVRALKDLDYERSVGKISEEDYAELSARYRTEAKSLLRSLETELSPLRKKAEALLAARLKSEGLAAKPNGKDESGPASGEPEAQTEARSGAMTEAAGAAAPAEAAPRATARSECPKCHTPNDADARFCKRCGAGLRTEVAT